MDDLGARLKLAREERGVTLKDIATRTKISVAALGALERNDFSRLPGGIFGRAFVRAYALEIGLDPDQTVADFQVHLLQSEREAAERGAIRVEITPDDREFLDRQHRAVRLLRILVAVVLVTGAVLLVWRLRAVWFKSAPKPAPTVEAPLPVPAAPAVPDRPALPVVEPVAALPPVSDRLVIEFEVTANCWIFVSADGARDVSQLFKPGDHHRVEANQEILLDVGSADALQWTINGKAAKSLGRPGVHIRQKITKQNAAEFLAAAPR